MVAGKKFIVCGFISVISIESSESVLSTLLYPIISPFVRGGDDGFGSISGGNTAAITSADGCSGITLTGEYTIVAGGGGTIGNIFL